MKDKLTIALPVYKRTDFVRSALDSAVKQTVPCSILLIDNNSPHDDFKKIVDSYEGVDIKYIKTEETVPQDENFNNCFRYAETLWVTVLHDDDMLHCQFVEYCQSILEKHGDKVGGVMVPSFVSEEEWPEVYTQKSMTEDIRFVNEAYFYFNTVPFPGVLVNKDVALKIGGFNNELFPVADFDFWYRYSMEMPMVYIAEPMAFYRISASQSTNNMVTDMINNIYEYRLKLIKKGKHNNKLTRLGLEHARIENITYFKNTYDNLELPETFVHDENMKRAQKLLSFSPIRKIVEKYKQKLAFSPAK
jgi:glycosyltransferase involved in cell wall biosynthesis